MGYGEADHVADCKALLRIDANRLVKPRARGHESRRFGSYGELRSYGDAELR
jgi:hypothetical protein